jgi:hypothetical protein|tara:strand:+ start:3764 stop:4048 length:285 start_codon:yes stop_codon:yes gene_type:complete
MPEDKSKAVHGDVIEIPQEFMVLKDKYTMELNEALINYGITRKHGSINFTKDLDQHIKDIAHVKSWLAEIELQIKTISETQIIQPTNGEKTDDS